MIRAIIIDDETNARETLRLMLDLYVPDIEIVAEAADVLNALRTIKKFKPELLFLDINLGNGSGFDVLQLLPESESIKVIFVTAYEEHAIKAFKFSAIDYLVKPVLPEDLMRSCKKACQEATTVVNKMQIEVAESITNPDVKEKKIVLKTSDALHLVSLTEIIHCKSDDNYTLFQLTGGKSILVSKTLREYEDLLSAHGFVRVHNSYLINQTYISFFDKREGGYLVMKDEARIPVSSRKRDQIVQLIRKLGNI
jgi:two-component system LytT family response regulator